MPNTFKTLLLLTTLMTSSTLFAAEAAKPLKDVAPYPAPKATQNRWVINLPAQENEDRYQVELVLQKTALADCNRSWFGGKLEEHTLKGWGYNYLSLADVSGMASTLMGCPEDSRKERPVDINVGDNNMQRYNSKLPLVIYTPKDVTVSYVIWQAAPTSTAAVIEN